MPCFDPVLMIRPGRPCCTIRGANTWLPSITPHRLMSIRRRQSAAGPKALVGVWIAALFIKTSVPPNRVVTAASSASRPTRSETSVSKAATSTPEAASARMIRTARASRSLPRSAMQTVRPSAANRLAAARPMPEAPPVMTATAPGAMAAWVMQTLQGWEMV